MDYFSWIQSIDLENPDEVYEQLIWIINQDLAVKQKLFAIDLLVRKSKGKYIANLKNQIKNLSENNQTLKDFKIKYFQKADECKHLQTVLAKKNSEAKNNDVKVKKRYVIKRKLNYGM